jgi:hypothetical protein
MKTNPAAAETPASTALHAAIMSCPDCGCDLVDEAFSAWCPSCQSSVSFARVVSMGGGCDD